MKRHLFFAMGLCCAVLLSSCKSQESAYRKAYEQAQENVQNSNESEQVVAVVPTPAEETVKVTPVTTDPAASSEKADVRTIDGGVTVVNGDVLKAYSVVVGSFVTQSNAEVLMNTLRGKGYNARVVKTNETINGRTGWFRVIAASFDDKSSAITSRRELEPTYAGAWLLFNK